MAETCRCDVGLANTGTGCTPIATVTKKAIFVPYFDSTGAINSIDLTDTFDKTYFDALTNHADLSKRWFPLPELKVVTDERGEDVLDGDTGDFVIEGDRVFTGTISGSDATPQLLGKIKAARCVEFGVFLVDKSGKLFGTQVEAGFLQPIRVNNDSLSVQLIKPTKTTSTKVVVSFKFNEDEADENLRAIASDEMDYSPLLLNGLLDVFSTYSSITTTSFKAALRTLYGTPINPVMVKGLVAGDFALYNVTDSASVAIVTAVESPDGTYTFTYAAQTSADKLRLTPTKAGYDFAEVVASQITIP